MCQITVSSPTLHSMAFDKSWERLFFAIYHINLKGNARTSGERRRREAGNIFDDQIRVSVGITLLVKRRSASKNAAEIKLLSVADYLTAAEKKQWLESLDSVVSIPFDLVSVDKKHNWSV